ncbi:MAG: glycoside hydrolase family 44 protein [Caldilineaceae bacterium]
MFTHRLEGSFAETLNQSTATTRAGKPLEATATAVVSPNVQRAVTVVPERTIYTDVLAEQWQNWSWDTEVDFAHTRPVQSGASALAITYAQPWAAFNLHIDPPISGRTYELLRFWIHGGSSGGQQLRIVLADASGTFVEKSVTVEAPAERWQLVEVKLDALGAPQTLSAIAWQDTGKGKQPTYYLDEIALVKRSGSATATPLAVAGPALQIDLTTDRRTINPDIYGINYAAEALATSLQLTVRRWGGNATTRYNWQNDTANRASDWFFENIPEENDNPAQLPNGSAADRFVEQDQRTGTQSMLTMPLIGWTPKSREVACGYSITKYGAQQQQDPWRTDCGNGVDPNGEYVADNSTSDTSIAIDPSFDQAWIAHLVERFGTAAEGGVAFYSLDNEPMLWHYTHRDVHPDSVGYDELRDRTIAYAAAIKAADPGAQLLGPALWGWTAYFYSALDQAAGANWWNRTPDRNAHGGLPLVAWYLQEMRQYEESHGVRLLDYLDLHFYPQAPDVALAAAGNAETQALRLRSTRALWDPTYVDESWIDEQVQLIPRMHDWIDTYYPGTKLAISEYNWGALDHINGALAQADLLGIFGREGVDMALLWAALEVDDPYVFAFRMYRNYDGKGSQFGDIHIQATSTDQGKLAIYGAQRSSDHAVTVVVINKGDEALRSSLALRGLASNAKAQGEAQVFRYSVDNLGEIEQGANQPLTQGGFTATFPASSITLFVIPQAAEGKSPSLTLKPTPTGQAR